MAHRPWLAPFATAVVTGLAVVAVVRSPPGTVDTAAALYLPGVGLVVLVSGAVLVWRVDPAYTFSAALFLTPLTGNWPRLGVPGALSPDRLLLVAAIVSVLLRAPPAADRPRLRLSAVHGFMALAVIYVVVSAALAGTLFERDGFFKIVDAFGILPFLAFLVAPMAFRTPRQRRILLGTLVALGAYLGLTALFEMVKLNALVFPRYILDPNYGIHFGRARGPFVDAVANGLALYTCAVACAIAFAVWPSRRMRVVALPVGLLCMVGAFLSLERSVWIGVVLATSIAMLATRGLRRYIVTVVLAVAVALGAALTLIPGLSGLVSARASDPSTVWDRKNLDRAALNMVEARPLTGFGWDRFTAYSANYFQQAADYPLTASGVSSVRKKRFGVHNTPLTYAAELGLVGLSLWLLALLLGVGGALATRGPPDQGLWRTGLLAVAIAWLIVANAVPPSAWLGRSLWLLAGVAYAGRYAATASDQDRTAINDSSSPQDRG